MQTSSFLVTDSFANQPKMALLDGRWLSSEMVDYCSDRCYDWMGLLPPDRKIELYRLSLPKVNRSFHQKSCSLATPDLVKLTRQAPYQEIVVFQHPYWSYTCSLYIAGFGKVRFGVYFNNPQKTGAFVALVTNRLDWSASKILKHWVKHRSTALKPQDSLVKLPRRRNLQAV